MKKYSAAIIIFLAAAIAAAVLYTRNPAVMSVDGIEIRKDEFKLAVNEKKSETYSYFRNTYGAEDSVDFWKTDFNGITPSVYIKNAAKETLIDKKCRMKIMLDNGIISDASYESFKKELKKVNTERKKKKEKGQVIYGPVQYSEKEYEIYLMSNRETELKKTSAKFSGSDAEISEYYNSNKEKFKIRDTVTIEADGQKLEFTPELSRHDSTEYPEIYAAAYELSEGEECDVNIDAEESVHIKCISKKDNGYMSLDDAYDAVKSAIAEEKYTAAVETEKAAADIRINQKVYDKIKVE